MLRSIWGDLSSKWGELSFECGASCPMNVGQVELCLGELSWGELSCTLSDTLVWVCTNTLSVPHSNSRSEFRSSIEWVGKQINHNVSSNIHIHTGRSDHFHFDQLSFKSTTLYIASWYINNCSASDVMMRKFNTQGGCLLVSLVRYLNKVLRNIP